MADNVGFTFKLCGVDKAIAFENNPATINCEKHTHKVTSTSTLFANYAPNTVRGGSVGCGHLNQWLAAVKAGATSPYSKLCGKGTGTLCASIATASNEDLSQAVADGLKWFMIKYSVEEEYEKLPELIQRALNTEHNVGERSMNMYTR